MNENKCAMIIDDDHDIVEVVGEVLADAGFEMMAASSGERALALLRERLPGVILLDLRMPGMSGDQFRARQLAEPRLAQIPVVLWSADVTVKDIAASLNVAAWLRKPVDLQLLVRTLTQHYKASS